MKERAVSASASAEPVFGFPAGGSLGPGLLRGLTMLGLLLIALGMFRLQRTGREEGSDLTEFYHAARRYAQGHDPYVLNGQAEDIARRPASEPLILSAYGYPPMTSAALAPLSLFTQRKAQAVLTFVLLFVLTPGLWLAIKTLLPDWPAPLRVLILGLLLQFLCLRWLFGQLQLTTLGLSGMGIFLYGESRQRPGLSLLGALLTALKPTLLLPILLFLLFRGNGKRLTVLLGLTLAFNFLAALPTGLRSTLASYRLSTANFNAPGTNNHASIYDTLRPTRGLPPCPLAMQTGVTYPQANGYTGEQTSWLYIASGFTRSDALAGRLAQCGSLLTIGGLFLLWKRSRNRADDGLFLQLIFCAALCFSLLCVYHQRYDVSLLLLPMLFALGRGRAASLPVKAAGLLCLCVCGLYTDGMWRRWLYLTGRHPGLEWLVPLRAYGVSVVLLLLLWEAWRLSAGDAAQEFALVRERQRQEAETPQTSV